MYKLVIADDEGKTTVVPLVRDEITIGRKEGNTIRLTERNVSRRHARLARVDGAFAVEDLSSYNGIRVNGDIIEERHALRAGDRVSIGDYRLTLESDEPQSDDVPIDVDAPTPPARLVMLNGPAPGADFAIRGDGVVIGRSEELDVWVNHRSISREHAQVQVEGGVATISDLESANGVRVNGDDVETAELVDGDIVELGQIRFRFVGENAEYTFDPADGEADDEPEGPTALAAVALVFAALAIAVGAALMLDGGDEQDASPDPAPVAPEPAPEPEPEPEPAGPTPEQIAAADAAAEACGAALDENDWAAARTAGRQALAAVADHGGATDCVAYADYQLAQIEAFDRAKAALEENDIDAAAFAIAGIDPEHEFYATAEAARIRQRFAAIHLRRGAQILNRDPEGALREASQIVAMFGADSAEGQRAGRLAAAARRRGAGAEEASAPDEGAPAEGEEAPAPEGEAAPEDGAPAPAEGAAVPAEGDAPAE